MLTHKIGAQSRVLPWRALWPAAALAAALAVTPLLGGCGAASVTSATPGPDAPGAAAPTATEISAAGDVRDNAVFVTYTSSASDSAGNSVSSAGAGYSIQYVEGWTVTPGANGAVAITDIDSAEQVEFQALPAGDLQQYVSSSAEIQLQSQTQDYKRSGLESLTVNGQPAVKLSYTWTSAPDPVTNKSRSVTTERYYIPGPNSKLAVLTLTTPVGVDNVDAFNQMLESFAWTQ